MAFMKYARAAIVHPHMTGRAWSQVRTAARAEADVSENLVQRASDIFGKPFNPNDYLLTHATIVASVDTYDPPGVKLGRVLDGGFRVNRKFANFRVKTGCDKYINNNLDCWDRDVLLKSYRTFIGGHNFVEHVQIEDQSKGRIIDAVARDIGDSVYVDILIATDRQHADLVEAIENGKMGTLSMGCTVDGTICTKCGHWAADETEMCPHVKYEKGNVFYDEQGRKHRVAELCGHASIDPHGGVFFIEGSWVGTPAFTGAVLRNVLEPTAEIARKAQAVLATPPPEWSPEARRKAAYAIQTGRGSSTPGVKVGEAPTPTFPVTVGPVTRVAGAFGFDTFMSGWDDGGADEGGEGGEAPAPAPPAAPGDSLKELEDQLHKHLLDRVVKRVQKDMDTEQTKQVLDRSTSSTNEGLVKEGASLKLAQYQAVLDFACRTARSDADLMDRVAQLNHEYGVHIPVPLYRAALDAGAATDVKAFLRKCQAALGRQPTVSEGRVLIRLGKMLSRRGQARREAETTLAVATKE